MKFAAPNFLYLLPFVFFGGYLLHRIAAAGARRKLALFSPAIRLPVILRTLDRRRKRQKAVLFTLGLALFVLACARPVWGPDKNAAEIKGAEFYLVLDISQSMLTRDVTPDRLEAVKRSLGEWLKTRHGDKIGLILVAGDAFVQAPLTNDYTALGSILSQVGPGDLSLGGTNLPAAIETAAEALKGSKQEQKIIVIVSDGENLEGNPVFSAEAARAQAGGKLTIYTVGVGTEKGGPVPRRNPLATKIDYTVPPREFTRDRYATIVRSRLDERTLRSIAQAGRGRYFRFEPEGHTWDLLYNEEIKSQARKVETLDLKDYRELFEIPLAISLIILIWEFLMSTRLKNPPQPRPVVSLPPPASPPPAPRMKKNKLPGVSASARVLVTIALLLQASPLRAETRLLSIEEAQAMIKKGRGKEVAEALRAFTQKNPDDMYALYNYAIAEYANGQFQAATAAFEEVSQSKNSRLSSMALMQLGNVQFRLGQALEKDHKREGGLLAWENAVNFYQSALKEKPLAESRHNLKIVSEQLESMLLHVGSERFERAVQADDPKGRQALLRLALESFEKASDLNPSNSETKKTIEKTKELLAASLANMARKHRAEADKAAEAANGKEGTKQQEADRRVYEQQRNKANEAYLEALEVTPDNPDLKDEYEKYKKELAKADLEDAETLLDKARGLQEASFSPNVPEQRGMQAEQKSLESGKARSETSTDPKPAEKRPDAPPAKPLPVQAALDKQQDILNRALGKAENSQALNPENSSAEKVKKEILSELEKSHLAEGEGQFEKGRKETEKNDGAGVAALTSALGNFEKVLEINPDNAKAKQRATEAQGLLAKALTAVGKKEMVAAGMKPDDPTAPSSEGEAPGSEPAGKPGEDQNSPNEGDGKQAPGNLRKQIGHLEKAAASLGMAQSLAPGENGAAGLESQARRKLDTLRNQLDAALAAKGGSEESGEPNGKGESEAGKGPEKPVRNFSAIRKGAPQEGNFRESRKSRSNGNW